VGRTPSHLFVFKADNVGFFKRGNVMREKITLVCSSCKRKNYMSMKNKRNNPDRIELMKYCSAERKHTLHKEGK
jgi:large subunit ribosomal protein L33